MPTALILQLLTAHYPAPADDVAEPPLGIAFEDHCGPGGVMDDPYEARTSTFHIHFYPGDFATRIGQASVFKITRADRRLPASLAFRLTGVPKRADHGLRLHVDDRSFTLDPSRYDKDLFRVERRGQVTHITFTPKGLKLLKPGTRVSFVELTW